MNILVNNDGMVYLAGFGLTGKMGDAGASSPQTIRECVLLHWHTDQSTKLYAVTLEVIEQADDGSSIWSVNVLNSH